MTRVDWLWDMKVCGVVEWTFRDVKSKNTWPYYILWEDKEDEEEW